MPHGNGFDLLEAMDEINFETIFVTAYDSYAVKAFKFSAIDYIIKPVSVDDLRSAVNKAKESIEMQDNHEKIRMLLSNLKLNGGGQQKIGIQWQDGLKFVKLDDIIRLESEGSYTTVHLKDNKKVTATKTLKEFELLLPESLFFRIHNSNIININYLRHYYKGRGGYVEMEDGSKIEVSIRKKDEFLKRISF